MCSTYKKLNGHPIKRSTPRVKNRIKFFFETRPSTTLAAAAKEINISPSYLCTIKLHKLGIKVRTKKPTMNNKPDQANRINECCSTLIKKMREKIVINDDESYVPVDASNTAARHFYHCVNPADVHYEEKIIKKDKFPKKCRTQQSRIKIGRMLNAHQMYFICVPFKKFERFPTLNVLHFKIIMAFLQYSKECGRKLVGKLEKRRRKI